MRQARQILTKHFSYSHNFFSNSICQCALCKRASRLLHYFKLQTPLSSSLPFLFVHTRTALPPSIPPLHAAAALQLQSARPRPSVRRPSTSELALRFSGFDIVKPPPTRRRLRHCVGRFRLDSGGSETYRVFFGGLMSAISQYNLSSFSGYHITLQNDR